MGVFKCLKMIFVGKGDCYRYVVYKVMVKKKFLVNFLILNYFRGVGSIIFLVIVCILKIFVFYFGSDNMNGLIKVIYFEFVINFCWYCLIF